MAEYIDKIEVVNKLIRLENKYQFYKEDWDADTLYRNIVKLEIEIGKQLPADVAPVQHGCWKNRGIAMACSLCNADLVMEQGTAEINYCPNCGAKMDLE